MRPTHPTSRDEREFLEGSDDLMFRYIVPTGLCALEMGTTWPAPTIASEPPPRKRRKLSETHVELEIPRALSERIERLARQRGVSGEAVLAQAVNLGLEAWQPK